ncbi:MAG: stage III sporulation protein AF [Bacillota bacterium]
MELLRQIVGQLLVLSLLALLLELLLPRSDLKGTVRLVIGLFLLVTVLEPILGLVKKDWSSRLQAFSGGGLPQIETALREGERLRQEALAESENRLKEQLSQQVSAVAESITGARVDKIDVRLDTSGGKVQLQELTVQLEAQGLAEHQSVDVMARGKSGAGVDTRRLAKTLARLYGLDPGLIKITVGR